MPVSFDIPDFTLVIPTKGSANLLRRCIQYYQGWPVPILVVDTGSDSLHDLFKGKPWFRYFHLPHYTYGEQIAFAMEQVTSTYVQLIANDDFFLFDGLIDLTTFLRNNPKYIAVRGRSIVLCQQEETIEYRAAHSYINPDEFNRAGVDPFRRLTQCWRMDWTYAMMPLSTARMIYCEKDIPFEFGYLFEQAMMFKLLASGSVFLQPCLTQIRYRNSLESIVATHSPAYAEALQIEHEQNKARQLELLLFHYLERFGYSQPSETLTSCLHFYRNLPPVGPLFTPILQTMWASTSPAPILEKCPYEEPSPTWVKRLDYPLLCRLEQLVRFLQE